jgi:hypothetical protein
MGKVLKVEFKPVEAFQLRCTANAHCRKFKTNIPRKGIVRPQSQFPHSSVCERFIYFHTRSAYSAAGKYVDQPWEYIKGRRPQAGKHLPQSSFTGQFF